MSSSWGDRVKISIFGESHGTAIGGVLDGVEAGIKLDFDLIDALLSQRRAKSNPSSTPRKEADIPQLLSGVKDGYTTGSPIAVLFENTSTRSQDYANLASIPRPSHADYTANVKYGGFEDARGGGHFSGRLTAPLVFLGGVCASALQAKGIEIVSHISSIKTIYDTPLDTLNYDEKVKSKLFGTDFPVIDNEKKLQMQEIITDARQNGDSVGGSIECGVYGLPAGFGSPMFEGIENRLASILFGIPAVKGVEFGKGFGVENLFGSECNDPIRFNNEGKIVTTSNNNGGICGGISNGMPISLRVAIKPTPSIAKVQQTINLDTKENCDLQIHGRHDACIVPRAVPCVSSVTAIAIYDIVLRGIK